MTESHDPLEPFIERLREPVVLRPDLVRRVMAELDEAVPGGVTPAAGPAWVPWWRRRWTVEVTPLRALAAAAAVAAVVLVSSRGGPAAPEPVALAAGESAGPSQTQFLLVAPEAAAVHVVGDFNDWSPSATPLARAAGDGVCWVTVPLEPGRYRYAFVVDGAVWRPDPAAPAIDDEFGRASSVLTIGGT